MGGKWSSKKLLEQNSVGSPTESHFEYSSMYWHIKSSSVFMEIASKDIYP